METIGKFRDGVCSVFEELVVDALYGPFLDQAKHLILGVSGLASESVRADAGSIWLASGGSLIRAVIINRPVDLFGAFTLSIRDGFAGEIVRLGKPVLSDNVQKDTRFFLPEFAVREGLITYLGCPIRVGSKCIGAIGLFRKSDEEFTNEDVQTLTSLTDILGLAIHHCSLVPASLVQWQRCLDNFPQVMRAKKDNLPGTATRARPVWILDGSLPKGLHPLTLEEVRKFIVSSAKPVSCSQVSKGVRVSRTTARRYLAYLYDIGEATRSLAHCQVGRPTYSYSASVDTRGNHEGVGSVADRGHSRPTPLLFT